MPAETTRRNFLGTGSLTAAGLLAAGGIARAQHKHVAPAPDGEFSRERPTSSGPVGSEDDRGRLVPGNHNADEPVLVVTPDLPKLDWEMNDGSKEFHLHCGHTRREFLPDMWFDVWGFNDSMPGPMIEAFEGDRVRIVVHNELPESTTVHWHGLEVPNGMDGVHGLTQDPIKPGASFVYEFDLHQNGTFFYHSHGPMQEGMGMAGLFVIHPKSAHQPAVDHDFALMVQEWAILPLSTIPNTMSMEFNFFTLNGRSAPYITPLVVRLGSRVRIRFVNMSAIDHHPMHLHGHTFWITGTEAGRIPDSAWFPSNNVLVGVAQARDIEFIANNPGDWMIHCHMFHHMMNHMTSMVGPMTSHAGHAMPAGGDMSNSLGMITRGPALPRDHGPHALSTHPDPRYHVPGYPQDMMDVHGMHSPEHIAKFNKRETRGMREDWFAGVEGLMTVLRVLPPDLYDQVMSGEEDIEPGASVPDLKNGSMPYRGRKSSTSES